MNKIIKVIRLGTSDEIKKAIEYMVDQLEKYNFTYCNNPVAFRIFSKHTPECYKKNDVLVFSRVVSRDNNVKNVITLKPVYKIEKYGKYDFRVLLK
jgi:hypothetical protein